MAELNQARSRDEVLKEIQELLSGSPEKLREKVLGPDDTFKFKCIACGKCCKHRQDIVLTSYDVFCIARYLHRSMQEVIEKYCEVYSGPVSHAPTVRLVPIPPDDRCPFLRNNKCFINIAKPIVCASYPLAKISLPDVDEPFFLRQAGTCGVPEIEYTPRQWLGSRFCEESIKGAKIWFEMLRDVTDLYAKHFHVLPVQVYGRVLDVEYFAMFINYDTTKPYVQQAKDNHEKLIITLESLVGILTQGVKGDK